MLRNHCASGLVYWVFREDYFRYLILELFKKGYEKSTYLLKYASAFIIESLDLNCKKIGAYFHNLFIFISRRIHKAMQ